LKREQGAAARSVGRPPKPIDDILSAALLLVDEGGPDSLSMRTLAQRLDSGTAMLYRQFASKDEILVHVVDLVLGEIGFDVAKVQSLTWQEACVLVGENVFKVLRAHPRIVPLLVSQIPVGPNALVQRERAVAFLLASGFPPETAARAYSAVMHFVFGFANQMPATGPLHQSSRAELRKFYRGLDKKAFPAIITVAEQLPMISDDEEFRFGLQLVIRGLESLPSASMPRVAPAKRKK
jgi:TetR/AcrR family transcriptional regulator, tetracycline repressor protein